MSVEVKVTTPPAVTVQLMANLRRAMAEAAAPIIAAAAEGAPHEPEPRHDVHLNETGFIKPVPARADGTESVAVGFTAYWAKFQEMNDDYHHDHGHAHFLETAVLEGADGWLETVAAAAREGLGK